MIFRRCLAWALFLGALAGGLIFAAERDDEPPTRVVEITAKRFEFSPATIALKRGETVTLRLHSEDVTHGLFQRALRLSATLEPGKTTDVTLTPQVAGKFLTICDHFCGAQHGNMHMTIVVEEQ
jgi:cytochrome c oxidase subunit 2